MSVEYSEKPELIQNLPTFSNSFINIEDLNNSFPDIEISNTTECIQIYEENNNWKNYYDFYNNKEIEEKEFYQFLLKLFKTGDIIKDGITYEFTKDNYIDTTYFKRGYYKDDDNNIHYVLNAGDILTFQTLNFDFGIFITEVKIGDKTISKINSNIYEKPEPSYLLTNDNLFSTCKDTLGNSYVIKIDDSNFTNTKKILNTYLNTNIIKPSNQSIFSQSIISNSNYQTNINNLFKRNKLISKYNKLDYKEINNNNTIVFPNNEQKAIENNEETIKNFDCIIKGFFSFHRSKNDDDDDQNEDIIQCMNFEICFDNEIKTNFENNNFKGIEINFLNYINKNNKFYIYLKNDPTNSSCFFSGGGFYNINQHNEGNNDNNIFEIYDDNEIKGFSIHSPYFFTNVNKVNNNHLNPKLNNYFNDYKSNDINKSIYLNENKKDNNEQNNNCNIV